MDQKYKVLIDETKARGKDIKSMQLCGELFSFSNSIIEQCNEKVGKHALSEGRFVVMLFLYSMGELTPSELSRMTGLTRSAMTSVIDFLEKNQYAIRNTASTDRRSFTVKMEETGRVFFKQVLESQLVWLDSLAAALDDEEKTLFLSLIKKMKQNVPG